jgi:hypothetical protein
MINKDLIFSRIEELEGMPEGSLVFKNNNIYFDHLNLSLLNKDILQRYGVTISLANKLNSFYGRIGEKARTTLKKPVALTGNEIKILFKASVRVSIQEVSEHIGISIFKNFHDSVQVVLGSLWRQYGRLIRSDVPALAMVSRMLIRGHIKSAIHYLKDEQGWSVEGNKFILQRIKEAAMLEVLFKEGK